ncbi:NAD(P)/FAD-dependent oxidoreductase [Denitrificimonas caeni]|uniref:NAD(P)/FAD-dependent oxidoreductase n=1 Tax=Denitrificimonas caeni TaxID=521720 RepID=UPI000480DBA3|nr:NAD(P)/FAD-dependent oxidoreductase [Denitrificimonas caeni]
MLRLTNVKLPLDHSSSALKQEVIRKLELQEGELLDFSVFKRSYDARKSDDIFLIYSLDVELTAPAHKRCLAQFAGNDSVRPSPDMSYKYVADKPANFPQAQQLRPVIIGFGPCGILAALLLAQMGLKPIVIERGQDVRQRTKDTWGLWRDRELNEESNVQYGEGGAGTFSDGKLYTQIKDPKFYGRKVLTEFVKAGAPEEILFVSKPHIGTFKLVKMMENIRAEIIALGGEIRFGEKLAHLNIEDQQVTGLTLNSGEVINTQHVILAIGHSARDTFQSLLESGVYIEAKPFSVGLRIEHPQSVIDKARFGVNAGNEILGAADYKLVHHCQDGRNVYSFCMCPGGTVVAAASEPGKLVINGMSEYSRNERNANSAIVVDINPAQDYPQHPLAGIDLQRQLEEKAFLMGGENYNAPAQLVGDFLAGKASEKIGSVQPSYKPGVTLSDLSQLLPDFAVKALREAIPEFNKQIKGFSMYDAVLTGVETRTSSPVCIKRDKDSFISINTKGLYPAGEGAGYAGGILSAGVDGIKVAEALALDLLGQARGNVIKN